MAGTDEGYNYFKPCLTVSQIMGELSNLIDKPDFRMISNTMTLINLQRSWFRIHMLRLYLAQMYENSNPNFSVFKTSLVKMYTFLNDIYG